MPVSHPRLVCTQLLIPASRTSCRSPTGAVVLELLPYNWEWQGISEIYLNLTRSVGCVHHFAWKANSSEVGAGAGAEADAEAGGLGDAQGGPHSAVCRGLVQRLQRSVSQVLCALLTDPRPLLPVPTSVSATPYNHPSCSGWCTWSLKMPSTRTGRPRSAPPGEAVFV